MKIFIMTDLEGPSGVVARPSSNGSHQHEISNYAEAGELLTQEVNACAKGLFNAGADEVIAIDGHGGGNAFSHTRLDPRVAAGSLGGVMYPRSFGLGPSFDAAIQLGAHAMNGRRGFLNHTFYQIFCNTKSRCVASAFLLFIYSSSTFRSTSSA